MQGEREERNAIVCSGCLEIIPQDLFIRINWGRMQGKKKKSRELWGGENTWYKALKQSAREISPNIQAENTRTSNYNQEGQNVWNKQSRNLLGAAQGSGKG